jgi:hypothetical protein
MDTLLDLKAGPSKAQARWKRQTTTSQGFFKALATALVLALSCLAFIRLFLDQQKHIWFWEKGANHENNEWHHESSTRTQYLLGVGKADITGYCPFEPFLVSQENKC